MSDSKAIYLILKSIDFAFENNLHRDIFDLDKIKISERRLRIILKSLYDSGYIDGIDFIYVMNDDIPDYKLMGCYLTIQGMLFLEENSTMKTVYRTLKEAKEWIPGL
ncbi:YjcQ family protein [uncultured Veillonella sp.]|uniref:YjcQ family protein n=1 Tax=uncultured Veillonella sp. TaxID=159268 RepID=UPI0025981066|nr:YjcQ family protein [uncultured Veillonella sp.]